MASKRQRTDSGHAPTPEELREWRDGTTTADWIHMNAAGASPSAATTHAAVVAHLEAERHMGGYAAAAAHVKAGGRDARKAVAELIGCDSDEVALVESAQVAWSKAFYSLEFRAGDRILCFASEYAGNAVAYLQMVNRTGAKVEVLPMRTDGVVDVGALGAALQAASDASARCLVALTHVQTDSSIVQPAAEVGALARKYGAVYLLDTCQSIGQLAVDVRALGCDFACGTGRKWLRGPRGSGFLYARRGVLPEAPASSRGLVGEPPIVDHVSVCWKSGNSYELSAGARRYEMWEASEAARVGLAVAVDACRAIGPERIAAIANKLASRLRSGLASIPGIVMRDAPPEFDEASAAAVGASRCAIVLFEAKSTLGVDSVTIGDALANERIGISIAPAKHHFDDTCWALPAKVRLSPTYFNTEEEVDKVVGTVRRMLAELGRGSE